MYKLLISMALFSMLGTACVTPIETKPQGYAKADVLGDEEKTVDSKEILSSLSRSHLHESGIYESLYVEVMLKTPVSEYQKLKKLAVVKKWSDDEVKAKLKKIVKKYSKKVCFDVLVKSNDQAAKKVESWKISLKQGKKKASRKAIASFNERTPNSVFASVDRTFDHVQNDMQLFLETQVCFKKKVKFDDELILKIRPDFNKEVDEIKLSWWFE